MPWNNRRVPLLHLFQTTSSSWPARSSFWVRSIFYLFKGSSRVGICDAVLDTWSIFAVRHVRQLFSQQKMLLKNVEMRLECSLKLYTSKSVCRVAALYSLLD
jgi:hypothetical protein